MTISRAIEPAGFLRALFDKAVAVADPVQVIPGCLPARPQGRLVVVGAGKASARMAEAVEAQWGACEGLVITRYGHGRPTQGIEIVEAAHPVPDEAGWRATTRILDLLNDLGEGDFVLSLISGGASALLVQPAGAMTLAEKKMVNASLLASGAPIRVMNQIRKHLSKVKGGQLAAAAWPATMLSLMISDVPGDDPSDIGSGPTTGEPSDSLDVLGVAEHWNVVVPASARQVLEHGSSVIPSGDPRLSRVENRIIAAPSRSLAAARQMALALGCEVEMLGDSLEGEARDVAALHASLARRRAQERASSAPPLVILSGGELTVTRRRCGVGGPNAEYALALAIALAGAANVYAIACDTDGVDGAAEIAGAIIGPDTLAMGERAGIDAVRALEENDAHNYFAAAGGQVITGPTLTNVNDFRAILIDTSPDYTRAFPQRQKIQKA